MKYANMFFEGREYHNLGDNLQILAIENIYRQMGIETHDIVRISYRELGIWKSGDGEKAVLPVNFPFLEYQAGGISQVFSEDIIPVFLGFTLVKPFLSDEEIKYLKKWEPIGCRDDYTFRVLRRYGIDSWLNGCMTLTLFERRQETQSQTAVFLIDVQEDVREKLPEEIRKKGIELSHVVNSSDLDCDLQAYIKSRFREYRDRAALVITSRLHCAVPCTAMGIPVVLIVAGVSFRFSWVERLIPVYTVETMHEIDWGCKGVQCGEIAERMLSNAKFRIWQAVSGRDRHGMTEQEEYISRFFQNREHGEYMIDGYSFTVRYIGKHFDKDKKIKYAFWGITYLSEIIYHYICLYYPKAELVGVYDKNRKVNFHGIESFRAETEDREKLQDTYIFVSAWAATRAAEKYFEVIGKKDKYCLCYE